MECSAITIGWRRDESVEFWHHTPSGYSRASAYTVKSSRSAGRIGWSRSIVGCCSEHRQNWRRHCFHSEDSSTLNTSFIERHNLTIRQGCSYLGRRTPCHARRTEFLEGQVALLMAYYNFLRPHRALKFGTTIRTPAMQAGLTKKRLSFRNVFTSRAAFFLFVLMMVVAGFSRFDFQAFPVRLWRRGHGSTTLA